MKPFKMDFEETRTFPASLSKRTAATATSEIAFEFRAGIIGAKFNFRRRTTTGADIMAPSKTSDIPVSDSLM